MPQPGCAWWHLILSGRNTWLPGDARGFRNRDHRVHSSGDYKNRPPQGEHQGLYDYHKQRAGDPIVFQPTHRTVLGEAMYEAICRAG